MPNGRPTNSKGPDGPTEKSGPRNCPGKATRRETVQPSRRDCAALVGIPHQTVGNTISYGALKPRKSGFPHRIFPRSRRHVHRRVAVSYGSLKKVYGTSLRRQTQHAQKSNEYVMSPAKGQAGPFAIITTTRQTLQ